MIEITLYILTGMAVYGGLHHLYLAAVHAKNETHIHVLLGILYLLLSVFALTSALSYRPQGITTLLPLGKLNITAGILLWATLIVFVASFTRFKPPLALAGLGGAWAVLLIRNIVSTNSLLYSSITPLSRTLPSGEVQLSWQAVVSHWWTALELTVLATMALTLYSAYRLLRSGRRQPALALSSGLGVLLFTTVLDLLVSKQLIQSAYLAPFGFVVFLGIVSIHLIREQARRQQQGAKSEYPNYNLTLNIAPSAPRTWNGGSVLAGRRDTQPELPVQPPVHAVTSEAFTTPKSDAAQTSDTHQDAGLLTQVSERLADISVYSAIALHRIERGDLEPKSMEMLCRRVQSQVLNARRLTGSLRSPEENSASHDPQRPPT